MPIYEYACSNCDYAFDELQKISEAALVHCPKCGEASLRKLLSAPKFRLKGKGWYETDFKTGDKRNIAGESDAPDKKKDEGGEKKKAKASEETTKTPAKTKPDKKASAS
ncbi:MAG: FmdB family zinc ribbon protein [Woeseiaceae bacterium]